MNRYVCLISSKTDIFNINDLKTIKNSITYKIQHKNHIHNVVPSKLSDEYVCTHVIY